MALARDVELRPFRVVDLELLDRFANDPTFSSPFEWGGFSSTAVLRRKFDEDGFLEGPRYSLAVCEGGGDALGWVGWRDPEIFGRKGWAWEIGALLAPEQRGRGVGSAAQALLVAYLFENTPVHRLTANTEVENLAEQRCLEKCGFRREGCIEKAGFRGGEWRDLFVYALLREEAGG